MLLANLGEIGSKLLADCLERMSLMALANLGEIGSKLLANIFWSKIARVSV